MNILRDCYSCTKSKVLHVAFEQQQKPAEDPQDDVLHLQSETLHVDGWSVMCAMTRSIM